LLQSPFAFYLLCAVLWWSALLPKLNPFDAMYNLIVGRNELSASYLTPAPVPRRTAQAMAGIFALSCGLFLHFGFFTAAYVMEAVFLGAVLALILGGFCLGSFTFHLLVAKQPSHAGLCLGRSNMKKSYWTSSQQVHKLIP
jgi:hypothetical protein